MHADASLGVEHIEALAGYGSASAAVTLESRHEARSHSPRYSLTAGLSDAFDERELAPELDRALEHFISWGEDEARAGRRDAVLRETAALVALLERAAAAGRSDDVVRLGLAIEGALAWGNRWQAWARVLELVLTAARETGDSPAEAAALHQLGTRAYGTGDIRGARHLLEQALALRDRIGDLTGAQTTRQNLQVINGPAPLLYRLSHLPLAILACVLVLLVSAAGIAGATVVRSDDSAHEVAELSVGVRGDGRVVSADGSIDCADADCRVERALHSELLLRPQPQRGWEFARWTRGCSGRGACRLLLTGDARVVAQFRRVRDPRDVTVIVHGEGTVVSHPAGITCRAGDRCQATFTRSRPLELTAAAAPGHRFAGWARDCHGNRQCVITDEKRQVVARALFVRDPQAVTLKVDVQGEGLGTVTSRRSGIDCGQLCSSSLRRRTRVVLIATAQRGSRFAGWDDRACESTSANTCTVTLDGNRRVAARFNLLPGAQRTDAPTVESLPPESEQSTSTTPPRRPSPKTLTVSVNGDGRGSITSNPRGLDCVDRCEHDFADGAQVELRPQPLKGSMFVGWEGGGCSGIEPCSVRMDQRRSVSATFVRAVTLTMTITGGGTVQNQPPGISCGENCRRFPADTLVTLTPKATGGSFFAKWEGLPGCTRTETSQQPPATTQTTQVAPVPIPVYDNPCMIIMRENVTAGAVFGATPQ